MSSFDDSFPEHELVEDNGRIYLQCGKYNDVSLELPLEKGEWPLPVEGMVRCIVFRDFKRGVISKEVAAKALGLTSVEFSSLGAEHARY